MSTQTSSCERARARRCCAAHAPSNPPGAFGNFRIARKLPHHPETSAAGNFRITRKLPDQKRRSVEDRVWLAQPKPPSGWKLPRFPDRTETSGSHQETSASHGNFQTKSAGRSRIGWWLAQPKPPSGWKLPKLPAMLNGGDAAARGRRLVRCLARGNSWSWLVVPREYAVSTP